MRIFSTFTGIGGFEVGIRNAYIKHAHLGSESEQEERPQGWLGSVTEQGFLLHPRDRAAPLCVGHSEIDKYAESVYQYHFPRSKNYGDITKIKPSELPDFECLVGGFPCQAFSVTGKRRGFADTRGTLFFDLVRILKEKQPRLFVFENVKGLLSHDEGRTFTTIIATIDELGYDCQWQVLNSKDFGVPQNRERVIIVGHLRGTPRPEVFPITGNSEADFVLPTLTARYAAAQSNGGYIRESAEGGANEPNPAKDGHITDAERGNRRTPRASDIRRLTPLECERLQAFPDNWTEYGKTLFDVPEGEKFSHVLHTSLPIPISDSRRYKMCGNAVTTNVIQAVFERLFASEGGER